MAEPITVEGIAQEPTDRRRRPSGHVINAVLPIRKGQTFSSDVFLFFEIPFWIFGKSAHRSTHQVFAFAAGEHYNLDKAGPKASYSCINRECGHDGPTQKPDFQ